MWDYYDQNVIRIFDPELATQHGEWHLLSFAWKFKGDKKVQVIGLPDFPGYQKNKHDDKKLCEVLWKLLDEADIVVAHNGNDFDKRKLQARLLKHGMAPPSPSAWVDTKLSAHKHFKLNQNTLKYIASFLDVRQKIETGGFDLWFDCDRGLETAWKKMLRYNKRDVEALEDIYERLLPWMDTHPNVTLPSGDDYRCPRCGSFNVRTNPSWWNYLKSYRRKRYHCKNCGRWSQGVREKLTAGVLQ